MKVWVIAFVVFGACSTAHPSPRVVTTATTMRTTGTTLNTYQISLVKNSVCASSHLIDVQDQVTKVWDQTDLATLITELSESADPELLRYSMELRVSASEAAQRASVNDVLSWCDRHPEFNR